MSTQSNVTLDSKETDMVASAPVRVEQDSSAQLLQGTAQLSHEWGMVRADQSTEDLHFGRGIGSRES